MEIFASLYRALPNLTRAAVQGSTTVCFYFQVIIMIIAHFLNDKQTWHTVCTMQVFSLFFPTIIILDIYKHVLTFIWSNIQNFAIVTLKLLNSK